MLLIDDLLMAPWRGFVFVLREIDAAARAEREAAGQRLFAELAELHRRLDGGEIDEEEFALAEALLLDRLDGVRATEAGR
jgi:gas vesicle protein GvpG